MMKTTAFLAVAALAASAPLMAQEAQKITLLGQVQSNCSVGDPGSSGDLDFGTVGGTASADFSGIDLRCNSANGVTVVLTSRNGALQAGNVNAVNYQATLTAPEVDLVLFLEVDNRGRGTDNREILPASPALSAGTTANLNITVPSTPAFSGVYTDDLTISVISGG